MEDLLIFVAKGLAGGVLQFFGRKAAEKLWHLVTQ